MSSLTPHGINCIADDIRGCRDVLVTMRADYVQAFAAGEDGPFMRQELVHLQSIIMAFDAVIEETGRLTAPAAPEGGGFAVIDGAE